MDGVTLTRLLPTLAPRRGEPFNVFDVMHHGTHEKQLSNVFAWLLDPAGTHDLQDTFQRMFIAEVNAGLPDADQVPGTGYQVLPEANTSAPGEVKDLADLVLDGNESVVVIENYHTSDGHGHDYYRYLALARQDGKRGVVVMLCAVEDPAALTNGWQDAVVVTHEQVVRRLTEHVAGDPAWRATHPQQCVFFEHMDRHFVGGRRMNDDDVIAFINAMCVTGEADMYGRSGDWAVNGFADRLRQRAVEQVSDSILLLLRVKSALRDYCATTVRNQVNAAAGADVLTHFVINWKGQFQWTVSITVADGVGSCREFQVRFGPSAWQANEAEREFTITVDPADADYTHLFLTRPDTGEVRQSAVTMTEILDGVPADDHRLADDILALLRIAPATA